MKDGNTECAIRRATPADASTLATLSKATFAETFGHLYPPEDLQTFLADSHSVDAWSCTLADPQRAAWIAEPTHATPIGFIVVGACKLPVENREAAAGEVLQLYVLARHHNLHVGSRLMEIGLTWLAGQGRTPVYIGVWSENFGAQRFYGRYGFDKVGEYGYPVGKTVDREFILKR